MKGRETMKDTTKNTLVTATESTDIPYVNSTDIGTVKGANSYIPLVGGMYDACALTLAFKDDADDKLQTSISTIALKVVQEYNNIVNGYYKLLPAVAQLIGRQAHKYVKGVKTPGQLLQMLTGCSQPTSSELTAVAKRFYTSDGEPVEWVQYFSYSELIKLSTLKDEEIEIIKDVLGEKHLRSEVVKAIKDYRGLQIDIKNGLVDADTTLADYMSGNATKSIEENKSDAEENKSDAEESKAEVEESNTSNEENSQSAVDTTSSDVWLTSEKLNKLKEELKKCSKGSLSKSEMQEISFRALQTIKAFEVQSGNPFEE